MRSGLDSIEVFRISPLRFIGSIYNKKYKIYNSHLRRKFLKTSTAAVKTSTTDALLQLLLLLLLRCCAAAAAAAVDRLESTGGGARRYRFMTVTRLSG